MKRALRSRGATVLAGLVLALSLPLRGGPSEVRSGDRLAYALTGARVIAAPGRMIESGVIIVRGGVLVAVGPQGQTPVPADARVFEMKGKVVHAAFLDPYVPSDRLAGRRPRGPSDEEEGEQGPGGRAAATATPTAATPANPAHPEERLIDSLRIQDRVADTYRRLGFAVVAAVPSSGVLRGRGAVVSLAEGPMESRVLASESGQYISLEPERLDFANFTRAVYPTSKMGAVAMTRQDLLDAIWWRDGPDRQAETPVRALQEPPQAGRR